MDTVEKEAPQVDSGEQFFKVREIADRYKVHEDTVRRWIKARDLEVQRIGGVIRISASELSRLRD
jgi:excisionase family DNA binding protein